MTSQTIQEGLHKLSDIKRLSDRIWLLSELAYETGKNGNNETYKLLCEARDEIKRILKETPGYCCERCEWLDKEVKRYKGF